MDVYRSSKTIMKRLAKRIIEHRPDHSFDKHPKCAKINYSLGDIHIPEIDRNINCEDKISQIMNRNISGMHGVG